MRANVGRPSNGGQPLLACPDANRHFSGSRTFAVFSLAQEF